MEWWSGRVVNAYMGKHEDRGEALHQYALWLTTRGSLREAFLAYKRLMFEFGEQTALILSEVGQLCWRLGLTDEAEECFSRALMEEPGCVDAKLRRVEMYLGLGRQNEASEELDDLLLHHPDNLGVNIAQVHRLLLCGDPGLAWSAVKSVAVRFDSRESIVDLARVLTQCGYASRALELLGHRAEMRGSAVEIRRASALAELGRWPEAKSLYRNVLNATPDEIEASCGLAKILTTEGDVQGALSVIDRAIQLAPGNDEAKEIRLTILASGKAWQSLYELTALELMSDSPDSAAVFYHSVALAELGRTDELESFLAKYQGTAPSRR